MWACFNICEFAFNSFIVPIIPTSRHLGSASEAEYTRMCWNRGISFILRVLQCAKKHSQSKFTQLSHSGIVILCKQGIKDPGCRRGLLLWWSWQSPKKKKKEEISNSCDIKGKAGYSSWMTGTKRIVSLCWKLERREESCDFRFQWTMAVMNVEHYGWMEINEASHLFSHVCLIIPVICFMTKE